MLYTVLTLHDNGIQTDMLGQPLEVGDIILCKGYSSCDKDSFATIERVNKKTVGYRLQITRLQRGPYVPRPENHTGSWNYYPNHKLVTESLYRTRPGYDTVKVSQEFLDTAKARCKDITDKYPEVFL